MFLPPPKYSEIRRFVSRVLSKHEANAPKFEALRAVKSIAGNPVQLHYGDFTAELDNTCAVGWKLKEHPNVEVGFDLFDEKAHIYIKQRVHTVDLDVDRQSAAEIIEAIGAALNRLGFPGDKHAEIDVILRDKRVNQGKRIFRYDVKDYRTALEQLKAVLEKHKVSASIQRGAPQ
jgi:hypothetical protein